MADRYNRPSFIETDPISIPRQFSKKEDIEIAAFFAATIAWGQRKTILRNAQSIVERMDMQPHAFILGAGKKEKKRFDDFVHRTYNGTDAQYFLEALRRIYKKYGSMEPVFAQGIRNGGDMKSGIVHFRNTFFEAEHPARTRKHVPNPESGSSAKRLNMFLRWMVRRDKRGVDFGTWKTISPALLCCPLDVHSGRTARKLGLLTRKQDDWKALEELMSSLRKFDPKDPAKYDFALYGLGVFEKF